MTMSFSTVCKFCDLDKLVIDKQCNGVAAEIVTSHARWSFSFLKIWTTRCLQLLLVILRIIWAYLTWINGCLGNYLAMVRQDIQDMLHRCQICFEIRGDMSKMWVHERITAENNWNLAMITQTVKCNFGASWLITRHSSIWITNDRIHCSLPSQLPKLAKSGIWHCHLQWQYTRSCVTYMTHEWYQWKEDELLFT